MTRMRCPDEKIIHNSRCSPESIRAIRRTLISLICSNCLPRFCWNRSKSNDANVWGAGNCFAVVTRINTVVLWRHLSGFNDHHPADNRS